MANRRNRDVSDENEISICVEDDIQSRNRRKGKKVKKKQDAKKEENEDIFGGIDVEGIPDNEKEDIRLAILASRNDSKVVHEESSQSDITEKEEIESIPEDHDTSNQISDDDILNDETMEDDDDLEVYLAPTQKDDLNMTMKGDISSEENIRDEVLTKDQDDDLTEDDDYILDLNKSTLNDEDCETQKPESPTGPNSEMLQITIFRRKHKVEPTLDYEVEKNFDNCDEGSIPVKATNQGFCEYPQYIPDQNQGPRIKSATIKQDEGQRSSGANATDRSKNSQGLRDSQGRRSSQRSKSSDSQGSGGFVPTVQELGSQNSLQSVCSDDALVRHFRAVKFQPPNRPSYFCPEGIDPKQYIKVIAELIDDYNRKLKHAQKLFREKIPWPESVKPGQHHEKTIDVKRRGHTVQVFDMTMYDDDDDFDTLKTGPSTKATRVPAEVNSDDDLPELLVEEITERQNSAENITQVRNINKTDSCKMRYSATEAAAIITNTADEEDDIDTSESIRRVPASLGQSVESKKKRKQGIRKSAQKVLAPETQVVDYTDDIFEAKKKQKIVVAETQFIDENDWLNADQNPLGNQSQRKGLQGYTIPRLNKDTNDNKSNSNNIGPRYLNVKTQTNKKRNTKPKVLVEETQDFELDDLLSDNKTRNQKIRRACFKIESISSDDDEPVAETQLDESPTREDVNENIDYNHGEFRESEKKSKSQGFFAKISTRAMNTVKKMFSPAEEPIQESPENEPESPIIKRSRTQKLYSQKSSNFHKTPTNERDSGPVDMMKRQREVNTRVFGRNASKDSILSNNSDDISVASSQVSSTLLDDNGDLYSTQFPEKNEGQKSGKKRKAVSQHSDRDSENNSGAVRTKNIEYGEYTDDDIMVIDIDTKGKPQLQVSDTGNGIKSVNKRQRVTRNRRIDQCFNKEKVSQDDGFINERKSPVDYDIADEHTDPADTHKFEHGTEKPFPKTYSKGTLKGAHKIVNNFDKYTSQCNSVIANMLSDSNEKSNPQLVKTIKTDGWTTEHNLMDPVDIQNFAGTSQNFKTRNQTNRGQKGWGESKHRKELFNLDTDEVEISDDESDGGQKQSNNQRTEPVEMIDCPLCAKQFSTETIQEHAENCQGQDEEDAQPQEVDIHQNGEMDICCLCEKEVLKHLLERHVDCCLQKMAKQQQQQEQAAKEEPVQTRQTTKHRINTDTCETRSPRLHRDSPLRYLPDNSNNSGSQSTDGSSWDGESDTSGSDENITLKSIALSGTAALVDGPWNQTTNTINQSNRNASDWLKDISNSPIKSFVPISKQEDSDYYHKQFSYNKQKVEQRQAKRKRAQGKQKQRKKRRRVTKKTKP